jgi:hypothetical protein
MLKKRTKVQKRLAKVVMAALLCTNAAQAVWVPSVAEATEITLTDSNFESQTQAVNLNDGTRVRYPIDSAVTTVNVKITGSTLAATENLAGGYSFSATDVQGKTVNFISGTVNSVSGGISSPGKPKPIGNTVNISGGKVMNVDGGKSLYSYVAHQSFAEDNTVNISGDAEVNTVSGARAVGNADIRKNTVTITGGTVENVMGGASSGGDVNENKVIISGGRIGTSEANIIIGGNAPDSYEGNANNNTVEISGGTINSTIWGGRSNSGNAEGNTVTISGSPTFAASSGIHGAAAYDGDAKNNTVNILVKDFSISFLIGGEPGPSGTSSGNTLNIAAKGVTTGSVNAFQNMNFYLPSDIANNDTMLTVNGGTATDVKGVTFGVAALSGVKLEKGNTVNLITNPSGLTTADTLKTTDSATLAKASFLSANSLTTDNKYELSISKKGEDTIIATVDNVTEQSADTGGDTSAVDEVKGTTSAVEEIKKSPVETRMGVVTMVNAGADLLAGQGMANAADAAAAERSGGDGVAAARAGGFAPFAAVGLGNLRAESGSHVDTKSIGLSLGFAREIENKSGKLLVGPVVEYGHGKYDSYQDNGITADGKSSYWGIGVIAKQTNHNGFYYEGSLRAGRTKSDYDSDSARPGNHVSYDSSATYWAAHLGAGKLFDIGHDNTLDVYGKYFYSHTGSDSTTIHIGAASEGVDFSAVNSHRLRIGTRLTHALNAKNKIYGGLAWQYEFNGDARAVYSVSGEAPSPSVKGSSGMIELGWQVKPGKSPMTIDLGVTGWVGKQRGITANLQANWTF